MSLLLVLPFVLNDISWIPGRIAVPQGNVAVFYEKKVLLDVIEKNKVVYYNPVFTEPFLFDINSQTDVIGKFTCVAKDDQVVTFPEIRVTNQLPEEHVLKVIAKFEKPYNDPPTSYDKTLIYDETISFIKETCPKMTGEELRKDKYEQLNEILFDHLVEFQKNRIELDGNNTGIKILRVFFEIPTLDHIVEENRLKIAREKTAVEAEKYRQANEMKKKETDNKLLTLAAENDKLIQEIKNAQRKEYEESEAQRLKIKTEAETHQIRSLADANSYKALKEAQDQKTSVELQAAALKNNPEYLRLEEIQAWGCQNKVYFGDKIPTSFLPSNTITTEK